MLVTLDAEIDETHARDADRHGVVMELRYSQLAAVLGETLEPLTMRITSLLAEKNGQRAALGKPELPAYYRDFALLQEVTKGGCARLCEGITLAHTAPREHIHPFSVTSFFEVGIETGCIDERDLASFQ